MASREWKGFSEEELQLIKVQISEPDLNNIGLADVIPGKQAKFESGKPKKFNHTVKHLHLLGVKPDSASIKPEQKLSRSSSEGSSSDKAIEGRGQSTLLRVDSETQHYELLPSPTGSCEERNLMVEVQTYDVNVAPEPPCACDENVVEEPLLNNQRHNSKVILEEFEQRQRQLEAENAKRKLLLLQAIDDRKKRTLEESKKILKIQTELAKLDSLLSTDVSILRSQIEEASSEYDKAHKRYEKAEKEFVEAKLAVFQKMERKEKLTEHLCTIIEQNEARKAFKLEEMMAQLGLEKLFDNCKNGNNEITTLLPQLCALNETSLMACQTFKPKASTGDASQNNNNNPQEPQMNGTH